MLMPTYLSMMLAHDRGERASLRCIGTTMTQTLMTDAGLSLGLLAVTLVMFLWWKADWDVGYVRRVLWHRDSGTTDYCWKRSAAVRSARNPTPWPTAPGRRRVASAFGPDATVDGMSEALAASGALALVVIHRGVLTYEWYGNGGSADKPAAAFSMSKTVLSLVLSRAVDDGSIASLDASIVDYVPRLAARDRRFGDVTLADLLDMRSGIAFSDHVGFPWVDQDAPSIYYASDLARTVVERPTIESPPGSFVYNDYAPNLIGLALQRATGKPLATATQELWTAIGAEHPALWSVDDHGFAYHESGFVATARDMARIGQLVLDDGCVSGRRVAPVSFVTRSFEPIGREPATSFGGVDVGYHNGWWILRHPGVDEADLVAMGDHGQVMLVSPVTGTVVVRMGVDGYPATNISIALELQRIARAMGETPGSSARATMLPITPSTRAGRRAS